MRTFKLEHGHATATALGLLNSLLILFDEVRHHGIRQANFVEDRVQPEVPGTQHQSGPWRGCTIRVRHVKDMQCEWIDKLSLTS
jgi:hypothetical protein